MSDVRILVAPQDDNPYQGLLYGAMPSYRATVQYLSGPTRSQTVNVALAPLVLCWWRLRGFRILHLHWVFHFTLPWTHGRRWSLALMEAWFRLYLFAAHRLGLRVVWTAHDLTPHAPVFADDERASRHLARQADAVIALSSASSATLRTWGARRVEVIPLGQYSDPYDPGVTRAEARRRLGQSDERVLLLHFGKIGAYKGVDDLIDALQLLPSDLQERSNLRLRIIGACGDDTLRERIQDLAGASRVPVDLQLRHVDAGELGLWLRAADAAVLPFRAVTNSSSILLALSMGLPTVIPDLASLADVDSDAVVRYQPGDLRDLARALEEICAANAHQQDHWRSSAKDWAGHRDWATIAGLHLDLYEGLRPTRPGQRLRRRRMG